MNVYAVRWPNGDLSIVAAANKEDAAVRLDEFGEVEPEQVMVVKNFMVNFELGEDGYLKIKLTGEETYAWLNKQYPLVDEVQGEFLYGTEDEDKEYAAALKDAIAAEKTRVEWPEPQYTVNPHIQEIVGASNAYMRSVTAAIERGEQ